MSTKIKFNIFNTLFRLFSFLADKTNGWGVFVKPKLLFGSLIVGLGINAYTVENNPNKVMCYDPPETIISIPENSIPEDLMTISYVEQMPQFPGGEEAMQAYISKNLRYPTVALENGIKGKVICKFIVEKDGTISNIEVLRGVDPVLDKEAIRIIESMPRWIPGKQDGEPVRVYYTVPIVFKLQ